MSLEDDIINSHTRTKMCEYCFVFIPNACHKCKHCGNTTAIGRQAARRKEAGKNGHA